MAARAAQNRLAIAQSASFGKGATVLDFVRQPLEAMDDLDWLANEAPAEMGEGSAFGGMLERASQERELVVADDSYMHGKRPGVYGKSLSDQPWVEWTPDPTIQRTKGSPARVKDGGYEREVWGRKHKQDTATFADEFGEKQVIATEMARNVREVLALLTSRERTVLLARHTPRAYGAQMRDVFGTVVRVAHLAECAVRAWEAAGCVKDATVNAFLEGIALHVVEKKPRAGETKLVAAVKTEMTRELRNAYAAFEEARRPRTALEREEMGAELAAAHPSRWLAQRRYPHHSQVRRDRRRSLVGT